MIAHVKPPNIASVSHTPLARRRRWTNAFYLGALFSVGTTFFSVVSAAPLFDTFLTRVEVLASMETLNAEILASRSATTTLETWCADHNLGGRITATLVHGADKPLRDDQRRDLELGPAEPVKYRHVKLACGGHVLSEADNWYVPSRLTAEMNRLLETTDTPFGKAVAALAPTRRTIAVEVLWQPLEPGWERRPHPADHLGERLEIPLILFAHHAVLFDSRQRPLSEVQEHYTREILSFAGPRQ